MLTQYLQVIKVSHRSFKTNHEFWAYVFSPTKSLLLITTIGATHEETSGSSAICPQPCSNGACRRCPRRERRVPSETVGPGGATLSPDHSHPAQERTSLVSARA